MLTQRTGTILLPTPPPEPTMARSAARAAVVAGTAALAYLGICVALWRSGAGGRDSFVVVPQAVDGAHAPAWLPGAEFARINALGNVVGGRSILDPDLARDLAACYRESPWVADVLHVRRAYPNRLEVALVIRKPFAAVERSSGPAVVLDRLGVRLPASAEAAGLPLINGVSTPPPSPGARWEDVRVLDGLRVLERYTGVVAEPLAARFAARAIDVSKWSRPDARPLVEIVTVEGFPVVWGIDLPSGDATITGPSADEKLERLSRALPTLAEQTRKIAYISVRQSTGLVLKYQDDAAGGT
jgi:hypothetical protein